MSKSHGPNPAVITGLVPVIHVFLYLEAKTWMAGSSPAMTTERAAMTWNHLPAAHPHPG
jgi:hypothetical protein